LHRLPQWFSRRPGSPHCMQFMCSWILFFSCFRLYDLLVVATGKYQPDGTKSSCIDCALGRVQHGAGSTTCIDCLPGQFAPSSGLLHCAPCAKGWYSLAGLQECKLCPKPEYVYNRGPQWQTSNFHFIEQCHGWYPMATDDENWGARFHAQEANESVPVR